ncbi:M56 family metallopeptidase [Flavobacteriaceae bacterium S356]|uniref:M56 family metallopeptidase n=1 Tax=Asprobacillus argus TaxID=3076534 RepID=A0ABU3LAK3_9FLAO|nr:M56 family metallopeptidase [Flavobacteriaceae bacterium S356]
MLTYIIQVILFQAIFLAVYDFFLSKETFFVKNRWYLITTAVASFIIPFIRIPTFQKVASEELSVYLPEIVLSPQSVIEQTTVYKTVSESTNYLSLVFFIGIGLFMLLFLMKLGRLILLIYKHKKERKYNHTLIVLPNSKKAFSFFNYIFLGKDISKEKIDNIISHELVHSRQKHTIDLMLFELLKIGMWFNPMLYVYQKRIAVIHEYISDASVVEETSKETYINKLINELFDVSNMSFVNQFYKHTHIKKRIKMIMKEQSAQMKQIKYLLLIPMLLGMLAYTSCLASNDNTLAKENNSLKESVTKLNRKDSIQVALINHMKEKIVSEAYNDSVIVGDTLEEVPFTIIETSPTFPGCEDGDKKCFNKNLQRHVFKNFDSDLPNELQLPSGRKRIVMLFKIDKKGNVIDIKIRAPHKELEKECTRVLEMLPMMKPGKQRGKEVTVKYTLPMRIDVK